MTARGYQIAGQSGEFRRNNIFHGGRVSVTWIRGEASLPHKRCPQCAEQVRAEAQVCKHCGHRFYESEPGASLGPPAPAIPPAMAMEHPSVAVATAQPISAAVASPPAHETGTTPTVDASIRGGAPWPLSTGWSVILGVLTVGLGLLVPLTIYLWRNDNRRAAYIAGGVFALLVIVILIH